MAFSSLGVGAVGGIRLGDGQAEGLLVVADEPGPADEVAVEADRAEPLVVEVVGQAVAGQLLERDFAASAFSAERSRRTTVKRFPRN